MIVLVRWEDHDRQYTIGINKFFDKLDIDVDNAKIEQTIKKLLEQEEMKPDGQS